MNGELKEEREGGEPCGYLGGGRAFQAAGIGIAKSLKLEHATSRLGGRVVEGEIRGKAGGQILQRLGAQGQDFGFYSV